MTSIRTKLLLLTSLPLLLTAIALVVVLHIDGRRNARDDFKEDALTQFLIVSARANSFFQFQAESVSNIAHTREAESGKIENVIPLLQQSATRKLSIPWHLFGFVDSDGRGRDTRGSTYDIQDRQYFKDVMSSGRPVTAAISSRLTHTPVIIAAAPVTDAKGTKLGVVIGSVKVEDFVSSVASHLPHDVLLMAIDEGGKTVVTAGPNLFSRDGSTGLVRLHPLDEFGTLAGSIQEKLGFFETTFRDQDVLVYTARLPALDWPFAFIYPAEAAYGSVTRYEWTIAGLLALALLGAGIVALFVTRSFFRPIAELLNGFRKVGLGYLDTRLESQAKDEFGELTRTFNDMVVDLQRAKARSEEESSEKEKLLTIIECTPHAIGIADVDGSLFYLNPAGRDMLRTGDEMLHLELGDVVTPDAKITLHETIVPQALRNGIWAGDTTLVTRHGNVVPVVLTLICHREDHIPIYLSFIARDNSRVKAMEADLRAALERAEYANRVKDSFLTVLSHEILTPLSTVVASLEVLEYQDTDRNVVSTGRNAANRLNFLFSRLFLFLDLITHRATTEGVDFSLRDCLGELARPFASEALNKGISWGIDVAAAIPDSVVCDKAKLGTALTELLSNAVKFTSAGGVQMTVELLRDMKESVFVRFAVRDTGTGIAEDRRDMLFESFRQSDMSLTRQHGGVGLGLALTKLSVTALNGEIGVESELGIGSRFWFDAVLKRQPQK